MASEVSIEDDEAVTRKKISMTSCSNASSLCDFQNPELQKCMKELSDLIWNEIPKSEFVSLLNDYVESEFFLIDGDSLFIMCAQELTLQKGQSLHFFYLVERFLLDLTNKGAKYKIVFFKDAEYLYFRDPDLLSLRIALIIHLRNNTEIPIHTEFSTCLHHSWNDFLKANYPYFLIISDEGLDQWQTNFLHIFIIHTLSKRINVVLTSGQTSDAIRVYGYHIHSLHNHRDFFQKRERTISQYYKTLVKYLKESSLTACLSLSGCLNETELKRKVHKRLSQSLNEVDDLRYIVCINACSLVLEMHCKSKRHEIKLQEVGGLVRMYCLSVAFLHHLPLSQRARIRFINMRWNKKALIFIHQLKLHEFLVLEHLSSQTLWNVDFSVLPDLSDDHLWKNIAFYYGLEKSTEFDLDIGPEINRDYETLWSRIIALCGCSRVLLCPQTTSKCFLEKKRSCKTDSEKKMTLPKPGLIPMTNIIVERFAGDILTDLPFLKSDDPVVTSITKQKDFDELLHWHSSRLLSDDYDRTKIVSSKDPHALRGIQKLQTFLRFYGASLEGNISKMIPTQLDAPKKVYHCTTKSKNIHKTKAEKIIEENKQRRRAAEEKKDAFRWNSLSGTVEKQIKENLTSGIKYLEDFLRNCLSVSVKFTAEMEALNVCFGLWIEHCKTDGKINKNLNIAVEVMRRIHSLIVNYEPHSLLKETDFHQIGKYLWILGFENLAIASKFMKVSEAETKELTRKQAKYTVAMGSSRFQLQHMSHYLIREDRKDPDPRVQHFIPDTWQRELLDIVDNNESAVIVAPTSSGKTYASYYCMEKVLRESDEGVVVYVAPTKALVNQVWATIYNRFDKSLPAGLALCGVFTRDYCHDALNSQILVTVPQCLEILLLSPHRQKWIKKIKYVIFDEVHCLGGEIGAEIWEHLLVMIRCPFLALSATISNPKHLAEWLQTVKRYWQYVEATTVHPDGSTSAAKKREKKSVRMQNVSHRVRLVVYEERYNDLEKHICSVRGDDFTIHHFHPVAALTVDHIERYGFPIDLSLSPRETIILYDTMKKVRKNWPKAKVLDPETFFEDKMIITKADARCYEKQLKKELETWIKDGNIKEANKVLVLLKPQSTAHSEKEMRMHFPHFVEKLQKMDKLPALFFLFNVKRVEEWAEAVYSFLKEKEKNKKSLASQKEEERLTKKHNQIEKSLVDEKKEQRTESRCMSVEDFKINHTPGSKKQEKILKKSKKMEKMMKKQHDDDIKLTHKDDNKFVLKAEFDVIKKRLERISEIPPDCSYANEHAIDNESLNKIFDRATLWNKNKGLQKLALRGIGFHHASVDAKGRQMVEMLFRRGYLQVITATGTLALGINMPCKSVVFLQNSVYLDALNFRQMAGRAGRRGQDWLGNVYFYDIPMPKIQKLIKSNVPELRGQFPLSISLILRLMLLASKADDKEDAKAKVLALLQYSLLSFKQPRVLQMLKLYFLFCLQFLVKEGYVDQEGNTTGFSGLVTHLHYYEPSNIVLVEFLVKGLFHGLCQPSKKGSCVFSKDVMEKLVLVLAHLFGRRLIPAAIKNSNRKFYQSKVFLEDLPEDFATALHEYNCKIEENFGQFLQIVSTIADMKQEYQLPLSKIDFSGKKESDSPLASHLMSCDKGRTAVSPFVCLSGNTDVDLLCAVTVDRVILRTIGITSANIPVLHSKIHDSQGRIMPLNSYVLDFYKHGSLVAMQQDNGIHEGEAYALLKDFALALKAISVSLRELCENEKDHVVLAFEQLTNEYWEKLKKF